MNTVAVVIPNYNGKKYISDCLISLKKQTFKDFCVIIVDNASTDGSLESVEKDFADSFSDLKIIRLSENTGFANAVNVGIKAAVGAKYVFLLNNDTRCHEKAIEALVKAMDSNPGAFSIQAKLLQFKDTDKVDDAGDYYCAFGWAFSPARDQKSSKFNKRISVTSACGGAAMYRVESFSEIGLFDEVHFCYLEDMDIGYRARLMGYQNMMEPKALIYHAGSGSSGSRYNAFKVELTASNNLYLIYKNMPILQVILNLPLIITGILIKHIFYTKKGLGGAHINGLALGFSKIFNNSDRKVRFGGRQILNCIRMQFELWVNCLRLGRFL